MWSCGFQTKHPVELVFHLPSGDATSLESHGLSKISVWNYNRGIKVSHREARSEHSVTCSSAQQHNMHCYCFIVIDLSTYMYGKNCDFPGVYSEIKRQKQVQDKK